MKYIHVIARRYRGNSIYVKASNPGYEYVVAIPCHLRFKLQPEFERELYPHRPAGETYFVFECGNGDIPMIADSFSVAAHYQEGWVRGDLVLDDYENLKFHFAWNS